MSEEAKDPAAVLKKHFTTMQVAGEPADPPRYIMSDRNRARLERIRRRVQEMRRNG